MANIEQCLICLGCFESSTAFSKKNKLSAEFCAKSFKIFTNYLIDPIYGIGSKEEEVVADLRDWNFKKECLPFCSTCASSSLLLARLQTQLEAISDEINLIVEHIKSFIIGNPAPEDGEGGQTKVERLRNKIFKGWEGASVSYSSKSKVTRLSRAQNLFRSQVLEVTKRIPKDSYLTITPNPIEKTPRGRKRKGKGLTNENSKGGSSSKVKDKKSVKMTRHFEEVVKEEDIGQGETSKMNIESDDDVTDMDENFGELQDPEDDFESSNDQNDSPANKETPRSKRLKKNKNKKDSRGQDLSMWDHVSNSYYGVDIIKKQSELICGLCNFSSAKYRHLQTHIRKEHKKGTFPCPICNKTFTNSYSIPRHMSLYHSEAPPTFLCTICGKKVSTSFSLKSHMAVTHGEATRKLDKCPVCFKPIRDRTTLPAHLWTHKSRQEKDSAISIGEESFDFTCSICGKILHSAYSLKSHLLIHTDLKAFVCEICGRDFRVKCNLQGHMLTHLPEEEKLQQSKFACDFPDCNRRFIKLNQMKAHRAMHFPSDRAPKIFKCNFCEKLYSREKELKTHISRKHELEKRKFGCEFCDKRFYSNYHLQRHVNSLHEVRDEEEEEEGIESKEEEEEGSCEETGNEAREEHEFVHSEQFVIDIPTTFYLQQVE